MVEIGFKVQKDPFLDPEQRLGLSGVSFNLSFFGVAIVCNFWHLLCIHYKNICKPLTCIVKLFVSCRSRGGYLWLEGFFKLNLVFFIVRFLVSSFRHNNNFT